ncbi:response regulator receiver sensor signal transduction histidine kinase [Candidatus Moduliflexus flocculans]|uniref:histidine kinase n=1 Tax=Candidatus Moduliflexus flocculans TaxID=1499966 RepID=A0A081BMB8_9BACT|nr:response regulator receiver sensor signal transduction histidine kinase [Candidatus Moduliflexus flocculans]
MESLVFTESTILVVDDHPENLKVLTTYLRNLGCGIRVAMSGEKAIELADDFLPDLILLDVMMPGINGFETCRQLKQSERTKEIPVIFMTALAEMTDKLQGFEVGGVDYITKPLQHEEVIARVKAHLLVQYLQKQLRLKNELVQEQNLSLQQLNAALNRSNANKDKFFSIIAHDLRSPFAGLIGLTELILDDIDDVGKDDIRRYVIQLKESTEKLLELLENLLTWSRLQRQAMEYFPQRMDLRTFVMRNFALFASVSQQKQITMHHTLDEPLWAYGDVDMVNTVVRNLLSNALKFTKPGGTITISGHAESDHIRFSVADTGIGFAPEQLAKLFRIEEKFQRPGTAGERGTGLGLILCKELIEKNHGQIWGECGSGKGSVFHFTLPTSAPKPDGEENKKRI